MCIPHPETFLFIPFPSLSFFLVCVSALPPSSLTPGPLSLFFLEKSDPVVFFFKCIKKINCRKTQKHTHTFSKTTLLNTSMHFHNNSSRRNQLLLLLLHVVVVKINIFSSSFFNHQNQLPKDMIEYIIEYIHFQINSSRRINYYNFFFIIVIIMTAVIVIVVIILVVTVVVIVIVVIIVIHRQTTTVATTTTSTRMTMGCCR